jgi:N-methylhydantoinase A
MSFMVGCDTGGTFTDVAVVDEKGTITMGKALSTPPTYTEGIMKALEAAAEELGKRVNDLLRETVLFVQGTTIATNVLITRTGVKTGLITTGGHEHVHHIARGGLSKWSGLTEKETREAYRTKKVEPLVPKSLARGITERIDWKGSIVCPLDVEGAKKAVQDLVDEGVESIAVCLLWSFANPVHEKALKKILENYGDIYYAVSHELEPTLGEYARSNTAIIDCYVGPRVKKFLTALDETLTKTGLGPPMLVMQGHGGCTYGRDIRPYATFQSGPAAGVIGSRYLGEQMGYRNIIATDVGGTSFDVSLIPEDTLVYTREPVIARYAVSFPMVDIVSIGAGGGSIAWVDPVTKLLRVGPESAGANPGPACYGLGGQKATVTDADLVLGYLNPDYFLAGKMKLHADKAQSAVKSLAVELGWDVVETAAGIYDIVNAHMADLVRGVSIERGYDPRKFVIFAYGGNGPMHAAVYGTELGIEEIIVPGAASTYSALGAAISDILHGYRKYDFNPLPMEPEKFNQVFRQLETQANEDLGRDGIKEKDREIRYSIDVRYGAQYYTVRMPIERKEYDRKGIESLCYQFDELYETLYGKGSILEKAGRFVTSFILEGIGKIPKLRLAKNAMKGSDPAKALKGKRDAFFRKSNEYRPTDIYDYLRLEAGNVVEGPAVIEMPQSTVVIPPERQGRADEYLNIIIRQKEVN